MSWRHTHTHTVIFSIYGNGVWSWNLRCASQHKKKIKTNIWKAEIRTEKLKLKRDESKTDIKSDNICMRLYSVVCVCAMRVFDDEERHFSRQKINYLYYSLINRAFCCCFYGCYNLVKLSDWCRTVVYGGNDDGDNRNGRPR